MRTMQPPDLPHGSGLDAAMQHRQDRGGSDACQHQQDRCLGGRDPGCAGLPRGQPRLQGPQSMTECPANAKENGGAGSIAEQMIATAPDVLLGGGKKYFDQSVQAGPHQGRSVLQQAQASGYRVVTDAAGLAAAKPGGPLLGVFAAGNMDLEWIGPKPTPTGTPAGTYTPNPARTASQPHLAAMADKAIQLLDRQSKGAKKGFFCRSRAPPSTSRTTPPTPAVRSARPSPSTRP
jgi:Alkaline phosphatase